MCKHKSYFLKIKHDMAYTRSFIFRLCGRIEEIIIIESGVRRKGRERMLSSSFLPPLISHSFGLWLPSSSNSSNCFFPRSHYSAQPHDNSYTATICVGYRSFQYRCLPSGLIGVRKLSTIVVKEKIEFDVPKKNKHGVDIMGQCNSSC